MNPGICKTWLTPPSPHVSSIRRNLRPWSTNDLKLAYQYWDGFESESDHEKNIQKVSAGNVLKQIQTLYPEGLSKKGLDLLTGGAFAEDGFGIIYMDVEYNLEEDSWSVKIDSHIYDFFSGDRKTLSFKTGQEVLSWLQTHPPKSVSDSIFELARPVMLAYQNFRTGIDLEFNI